MRVCLYVRVSSPDRRASGAVESADLDARRRQDPNLQLLPLRELAKQRGWFVAGEYVDFVSGAEASRPGLDQVLEQIRRRSFDVLAVWKSDRLGRSLRHLLDVIDLCRLRSVQFVSLTEPAMDTTSPHGLLVFQILGACAEFERALDSERIRAGMENARRKGKRIGRPADQVDRAAVRATYSRINSLRQTARLHAISKTAVERILSADD